MKPSPDLTQRRAQINRQMALRCAVERAKQFSHMDGSAILRMANLFDLYIREGYESGSTEVDAGIS